MNPTIVSSRILIAVGLLGTLVGAVDPLEGSFVIVPSVWLVLIGAFLSKSRYIKLLAWSFLLVMCGVGAMIVFTWWGGLGGKSGHSLWWALFIAPYPVGCLAAQIGAVLALVESWKNGATRRPAMR
jgi:hypothetical protein